MSVMPGPPLPWPGVSQCRLPEGLAFSCVFGELFPGCGICILQQLLPFSCWADPVSHLPCTRIATEQSESLPQTRWHSLCCQGEGKKKTNP